MVHLNRALASADFDYGLDEQDEFHGTARQSIEKGEVSV